VIDGEDAEYLAAFALRLKLRRVERRLTQEELAERAGMHRTFIGQLERGERGINVASLGRLARALNLEGRDLLP
jgi:transcriptional regulator with XRE-family HTH domain